MKQGQPVVTNSIRKAVSEVSGYHWRDLRQYGGKCEWCILAILVAKREFKVTWFNAGCCFSPASEFTSSSCSSRARSLEARMSEDKQIFDAYEAIRSLALAYADHTSLSHPQ
jgi:hypothetical protein